MQNNSFDVAERKGIAFRNLYDKIVQLWNDQVHGALGIRGHSKTIQIKSLNGQTRIHPLPIVALV